MSHGIIKPIDAIFSTQGSEWHKLATVVPAIGETEFFSLSPRILEISNASGTAQDGRIVKLPNHKILAADYSNCRPDLRCQIERGRGEIRALFLSPFGRLYETWHGAC